MTYIKATKEEKIPSKQVALTQSLLLVATAPSEQKRLDAQELVQYFIEELKEEQIEKSFKEAEAKLSKLYEIKK
tara:strand:- start:736 stop:957 length:222 start_codon:yes stop_codon:yes gene_type:complete